MCCCRMWALRRCGPSVLPGCESGTMLRFQSMKEWRLKRVHVVLVEERRNICITRPNHMRLVEIVQETATKTAAFNVNEVCTESTNSDIHPLHS